MDIKIGDLVSHPQFGEGTIIAIIDATGIVRFADNNLQQCQLSRLTRLETASEKICSLQLEDPKDCLYRVMASAIRSVNDEWSVFSTSRISLLPHQLWVCRRVLEAKPARWLIADDVGLGKSIEAGLILLSLASCGQLGRALVLTPASLVGQWVERLGNLFDLRFDMYMPQLDTPRTNYWKGNKKVVASIETLRNKKYWPRLLESGPWDLVIVDEAHRLNAEERSVTQGFALVREMLNKDVLRSRLFFTGTPHKGKDYSFFSLLSLLRPDMFNPKEQVEDIKDKIPQVMIRNNKQHVTDMAGKKLFNKVNIHKIDFDYSDKEKAFYSALTDFITQGKAYACESSTTSSDQRIIFFILTTMQKLASSSIAAVRNALHNRIQKLQAYVREDQAITQGDELEDGSEERAAEEAIRQNSLIPREIESLNTLLELADQVEEETKILKIMEKIESLPDDESVLFFTEYKSTQALLLEKLRATYGSDSAVFINGDGFLNLNSGRESMSRERAAEAFNAGKKRFLVSTEAAGEGIDLQEHCHTLIHIDLPWNPMRLHQRVGRLYRYGQELPVEVYIFHNPETVESRIWECLDEKLLRITRAFASMDDPEDMCMAVIGSQSAGFYADIFAQAPTKGNPDDWIKEKMEQIGDMKDIEHVKSIFGSASRFDFSGAAQNLPQVELSDLIPFTKLALSRLGVGYKVTPNRNKISFNTPKDYCKMTNISGNYNLIFSRSEHCSDDEDRAGLGLAIIDEFVKDGEKLSTSYSCLGGLEQPIFIFRVQDQSTEKSTRQRIFMTTREKGEWKIYRDWELIKYLNKFADKVRTLSNAITPSPITQNEMTTAKEYLEKNLGEFKLPYALPYTELVAVLGTGKPIKA